MMVNAVAVERPREVDTASPLDESLTPEEWLLVRFYRQLDEQDQWFMRRAIERLVKRGR